MTLSPKSRTGLVLRSPGGKLRIIPLILVGLIVSPIWGNAGSANERALDVGDHFFYDIKWGIFKVGDAEILVEEVGVDSPGELKFVLLIRTTSWADAIYKVRNRIESYTDADVSRAQLYILSQYEDGRRREVVITFNWENNQAQFSNYGEKLEPIDLYENSHDPLSVLFAYRMEELTLGDHIQVPVTDGKRNLVTDIRVIELEEVKVKAGRFDCLRIEMDTRDLGGIFNGKKNLEMNIWFSNDPDRLIVKVTSAVSVGRYRAELRDYTLADSGPPDTGQSSAQGYLYALLP